MTRWFSLCLLLVSGFAGPARADISMPWNRIAYVDFEFEAARDYPGCTFFAVTDKGVSRIDVGPGSVGRVSGREVGSHRYSCRLVAVETLDGNEPSLSEVAEILRGRSNRRVAQGQVLFAREWLLVTDWEDAQTIRYSIDDINWGAGRISLSEVSRTPSPGASQGRLLVTGLLLFVGLSWLGVWSARRIRRSVRHNRTRQGT
jgi:hypothetical protein